MADTETAADTLIRDNKDYGSVGDFLKEVVKEGSELSVVSAYFTIFAYYGLHEQLDAIKGMKFLFGEPTFIKGLDADVRSYKIEDDSIIISPSERFSQKRIAAKCAAWIKDKVEIKSIVKPNFLHGKLYYVRRQIQDLQEKKAISGSSNFTTSGLGLKKDCNNVELNLANVKRMHSAPKSGANTVLTVDNILESVAAEFSVEPRVLCSKRQDAGASIPRKVAMYLCRELTTESLKNIGEAFHRDYSTVISSINSIVEQLSKDAGLKRRVEDIRYLLES